MQRLARPLTSSSSSTSYSSIPLRPHPRPLPPTRLFVMRGNHFCCHPQSVPGDSLCLTEWGGGVRWKMSSAGVHEGVKLQTPLCPRTRASKGISSLYWQSGRIPYGCSRRRSPGPPPSSCSPDCFCFQVTSCLRRQLFPISQGLVVWSREVLPPRVPPWEMYINLGTKGTRQPPPPQHLTFMLGRRRGSPSAVQTSTPPPLLPPPLRRNFIKWIIK